MKETLSIILFSIFDHLYSNLIESCFAFNSPKFQISFSLLHGNIKSISYMNL